MSERYESSRIGVKFNGVDLSQFVNLSDFKRSNLTRNIQIDRVPGRREGLLSSSELEPIEISFTATHLSRDPKERFKAIRELNRVLYHPEDPGVLKPLEISSDVMNTNGAIYVTDDLDVLGYTDYWGSVVDEQLCIDVIANGGGLDRYVNAESFEITFTAPDPTYYSKTPYTTFNNKPHALEVNDVFGIMYDGTASTGLRLTLNFTNHNSLIPGMYPNLVFRYGYTDLDHVVGFDLNPGPWATRFQFECGFDENDLYHLDASKEASIIVDTNTRQVELVQNGESLGFGVVGIYGIWPIMKPTNQAFSEGEKLSMSMLLIDVMNTPASSVSWEIVRRWV